MQPFTVSDVYALRMLLVFFLFLSYFCVMKAKKIHSSAYSHPKIVFPDFRSETGVLGFQLLMTKTMENVRTTFYFWWNKSLLLGLVFVLFQRKDRSKCSNDRQNGESLLWKRLPVNNQYPCVWGKESHSRRFTFRQVSDKSKTQTSPPAAVVHSSHPNTHSLTSYSPTLKGRYSVHKISGFQYNMIIIFYNQRIILRSDDVSPFCWCCKRSDARHRFVTG